jgi:hypothetical protein
MNTLYIISVAKALCMIFLLLNHSLNPHSTSMSPQTYCSAQLT